MRSSDSATYFERRDAISHDWSRWFDAAGITPVLVPNALNNPEQLFDDLPGLGLILTGGDDIGEDFRDRAEKRLLEIAIKRRLPVLGTCRGLQMINIFFGGELARRKIHGHVATEHDIEVIDTLGGTFPKGIHKVNSYHNNCVLTGGLAAELQAFAMAAENVVEGLYHPSLPITAVQWHPERKSPAEALDRALVQRCVRQCV